MDSHAGLDLVESLSDAHQRMRDAYWQARDIDPVVRIALAARASAGEETSPAVLGALKAIENDLGSFTWPDWAEPRITITTEQMATGLEAARRNLELAERLDRPALARSRAHWLLGAHLWAAGQVVRAAQQFAEAAALAEGARERGEALLGALYGATVSGADTSPIVTALRSLDRGEEHIRQVNEARRAIA